ncbi:MAG: DUF2065 domain-containing protein [Desulfamplus sp.]|nr:DUF2065 domain-containing protein [Desulfamplus sp.]
MEFFLCVVGMVMIVEGLPYFVFPEKMKEMVNMMTRMPDGSLRFFGAMLMFLGLCIVYFGKKMV